MTDDKMDENISDANAARDAAEDSLGKSPAASPELKDKTPEEIIHELQVHQIELEIQNQELKRLQIEAEASRKKYQDLYDFAPAGHFTLFHGLIVDANLTGAGFLGIPRSKLVNMRFGYFVAPECADHWYRYIMSVIKHDQKQDCDLTLKRDDGSLFYAHVESIRVGAPVEQTDTSGDAYAVRIAVTDITDRINSEQALAESEGRYRFVVEGSTDIVWAFDPTSFRLTFVSHAVERILGYSVEEALQQQILDLLEPQSKVQALDLIDKLLKRKINRLIFEAPVLHKNGKSVWCEITAALATGAKEKSPEIICITRDVTERKTSEKNLEDERNLLKGVMDSMADGVYIVNAIQEIEYINPALESAFGPVAGRKCHEYFHDHKTPCPWCKNAQALAGQSLTWEWYSKKTGKTYELFDTPLRNSDGTVSKLEIFHDITDRKQAEENLRSELEISSAITDMFGPLMSPHSTIRDLAKVIGEKIRLLTHSEHGYVNETCPATGDQMALTLTEMFGSACSTDGPLQARFPMGSDGRYPGLWGHSLNTRQSFFTNTPADHPSSKGLPKGHVPLHRFLSVPVMAGQNLVGQIAVANSNRDYDEKDIEITETIARYYALGIQRKRYKEVEALLTSAVEQAAEAVIVTDPEGNVKYVNPAFTGITGYTVDEIIGRNVGFLNYKTEDGNGYNQIWDTLNRGSAWTGRLASRKKDGGSLHVHVSVSSVNDDNGAIKNIVMVSRDISEEIRLQDQLLQSQKMEAIGTLAGGIAHEFNNVLFAIMGYIELVMDDLPEGSRARINSEKAIGGAERCADMVKQILTFSRPKRTEMIPLDLGALLKEAINFLGAMIPTTIEINQRIQPNLKKISGDATQIHQVLMNLCVNAWHAIEDGKGTISAELNEVELDANFTTLNPHLVPGIYVRLRVTDTGAGISPEIKSKIFDPYFTTKEVGSGTGLGLSVVHGIMLNHNGAITVTSELDKGSTFDVFFPVVAEKAAIGERSSAPGLNPRGNEHVLVVDDEKDLLEMYERQLKRLDYKVTCSGDPDEALELFRHDPHSFDMLLTDLQMPKMTGVELADKIVEIKPGLPVILCSGKNQLASMSDFSRRNIKVMVQKPVRMDEMARTIREALDRER